MSVGKIFGTRFWTYVVFSEIVGNCQLKKSDQGENTGDERDQLTSGSDIVDTDSAIPFQRELNGQD